MKASSPGPAKPFSIAVSALAAVAICGFSPACSQREQAYFLRTCRKLEMAWNVFDLLAFLAADLLSLFTAARTASLFCRELIDVCADREMVEIG